MLHTVKSVAWGLPTVCTVLLFAFYFTVRSRVYHVRNFFPMIKTSFRELTKKSGGISAASAMATSLGGTIGIGSITGVAVCIACGGKGSVFWMWAAGFCGCMLKYAETNVAVRYRVRDGDICSGGAMYALKANGRTFLGSVFAAAAILASFGTGNMTQSSSVSRVLADDGISESVTGVVMALLFLLAVSGGRKAIASVSAKIVPLSSVIYLLVVTAAIAARITFLPSVVSDIVRSAFGLRQIGGGVAGYTVSQAIRTGVTRCVFSSEMGMGSSPIVHSANESATPHTQGSWGIIETVCDVFVFSTLTAFALLLYDEPDAEGVFHALLGSFGSVLLPLLLAVFGFASMISWCFYAESCMSYLRFGKKARLFYRVLSAFCVFLGAVLDGMAIWDLADVLNLFMMIPNLYLLFIKRKEICLCFGKTKR